MSTLVIQSGGFVSVSDDNLKEIIKAKMSEFRECPKEDKIFNLIWEQVEKKLKQKEKVPNIDEIFNYIEEMVEKYKSPFGRAH